MDERRSCAQGGAGQGERMGWEEDPGHQRRVRGSERHVASRESRAGRRRGGKNPKTKLI